MNRFFVLSLCTCLDVVEIFSNVLRKMKSTGIPSMEMRKEKTEDAALLVYHRRVDFTFADIAIPRGIWQRVFAHRRINTFVVECSSAAITANQDSITSTSGAIVVVFILNQ